MNDDWTDFEDGERNGWENEIGSPDGVLRTEESVNGSNTFWSGKLEYKSPNTHQPSLLAPSDTFQPSLYKVFRLPAEERRTGVLNISFKYRVHEPEPGEATTISLTLTTYISVNYSIIWINETTPCGRWLEGSGGEAYSGDMPFFLIGTHNGIGGVSRKIDIDDIKVERVPDE